VCRDCVINQTKQFNETTAELTGIPISETPESSDAVVLWERFDTALAQMFFLHGFLLRVELGEESINSVWAGDSADNPSTRVAGEVALVRALLERHGYREVIAVVGIDKDLAASGQLGPFHQRVDPDDPRWAARIEFFRDGDLSDVTARPPVPTSGAPGVREAIQNLRLGRTIVVGSRGQRPRPVSPTPQARK
jgi:hypothetical protein